MNNCVKVYVLRHQPSKLFIKLPFFNIFLNINLIIRISVFPKFIGNAEGDEWLQWGTNQSSNRSFKVYCCPNKNDYNVIHLLGLLHCNIINLKAVMSFSSDGCSGPVYFLRIAVKVLFPSCQGDQKVEFFVQKFLICSENRRTCVRPDRALCC